MNLDPIPNQDDILLELFARYLDKSLAPDEMDALNWALQQSPQTRALFVDFCTQATMVKETVAADQPETASAPEPVIFPQPGLVSWLIPASLICCLLLIWTLTPTQESTPQLVESSQVPEQVEMEPVYTYSIWDHYEGKELAHLSPQTASLLLIPAIPQPGWFPDPEQLLRTALMEATLSAPSPRLIIASEYFWSVPSDEIDWMQLSFLNSQPEYQYYPPSL